MTDPHAALDELEVSIHAALNLIDRLRTDRAELLAALKEMRQAFRPFTSKSIGAPNSAARLEQDMQIRADGMARDAIAKAESR